MYGLRFFNPGKCVVPNDATVTELDGAATMTHLETRDMTCADSADFLKGGKTALCTDGVLTYSGVETSQPSCYTCKYTYSITIVILMWNKREQIVVSFPVI